MKKLQKQSTKEKKWIKIRALIDEEREDREREILVKDNKERTNPQVAFSLSFHPLNINATTCISPVPTPIIKSKTCPCTFTIQSTDTEREIFPR